MNTPTSPANSYANSSEQLSHNQVPSCTGGPEDTPRHSMGPTAIIDLRSLNSQPPITAHPVAFLLQRPQTYQQFLIPKMSGLCIIRQRPGPADSPPATSSVSTFPDSPPVLPYSNRRVTDMALYKLLTDDIDTLDAANNLPRNLQAGTGCVGEVPTSSGLEISPDAPPPSPDWTPTTGRKRRRKAVTAVTLNRGVTRRDTDAQELTQRLERLELEMNAKSNANNESVEVLTQKLTRLGVALETESRVNKELTEAVKTQHSLCELGRECLKEMHQKALTPLYDRVRKLENHIGLLWAKEVRRERQLVNLENMQSVQEQKLSHLQALQERHDASAPSSPSTSSLSSPAVHGTSSNPLKVHLLSGSETYQTAIQAPPGHFYHSNRETKIINDRQLVFAQPDLSNPLNISEEDGYSDVDNNIHKEMNNLGTRYVSPWPLQHAQPTSWGKHTTPSSHYPMASQTTTQLPKDFDALELDLGAEVCSPDLDLDLIEAWLKSPSEAGPTMHDGLTEIDSNLPQHTPWPSDAPSEIDQKLDGSPMAQTSLGAGSYNPMYGMLEQAPISLQETHYQHCQRTDPPLSGEPFASVYSCPSSSGTHHAAGPQLTALPQQPYLQPRMDNRSSVAPTEASCVDIGLTHLTQLSPPCWQTIDSPECYGDPPLLSPAASTGLDHGRSNGADPVQGLPTRDGLTEMASDPTRNTPWPSDAPSEIGQKMDEPLIAQTFLGADPYDLGEYGMPEQVPASLCMAQCHHCQHTDPSLSYGLSASVYNPPNPSGTHHDAPSSQPTPQLYYLRPIMLQLIMGRGLSVAPVGPGGVDMGQAQPTQLSPHWQAIDTPECYEGSPTHSPVASTALGHCRTNHNDLPQQTNHTRHDNAYTFFRKPVELCDASPDDTHSFSEDETVPMIKTLGI